MTEKQDELRAVDEKFEPVGIETNTATNLSRVVELTLDADHSVNDSDPKAFLSVVSAK